MLAEIKKDAQTRMQKSVDALKHDLVKLRTGRASTAIVEHLKVNYYGSDMPLSQVASVAVADARSLTITPWEKQMVGAVEKAILDEFREIESLGGVMGAVENRYQRSQIQNAAHRYEQQIYNGTRPIVGLTRYRSEEDEMPEIELVRTPRAKQELQVRRLKAFKKKNAAKAEKARSSSSPDGVTEIPFHLTYELIKG